MRGEWWWGRIWCIRVCIEL